MGFLLSIWPFVIVCFIFGTVMGSFLLTMALRIPAGESIMTRSHCPYCKHELGMKDLFPILSYIFIRGKCRYCGHKLPIRYLLSEILVGAVYALIGYEFGFGILFWKYVVLSSFVIVVAFSDLIYGVIPDSVVIVGAICGLILSILTGDTVAHLMGSVVLGGMFLLIWLVTKKQGIGDGDVTSAFAIGLYFDLPSAILVFMVSFVIGAIVSIIVLISDKRNKNEIVREENGKKAVPFVPFLSIASFIVALYSYQILNFLLRGR